MQIIKKKTDNIMTVQLEGRLDVRTSPILEGELKYSITDDITELIFDFEQLEYLSSAGIRVIMAAEKVMSRIGEMKIIHVNDDIMDIFVMTGLDEILIIEE